MTREDILKMKAGPQLNIALSKALGAKVERYNFEDDEEDAEYRLLIPGVGVWADMCSTEELAWSAMPPLSETWEGMRLAVEAMRAEEWDFDLRWESVQNEEEDSDRPLAQFTRYDDAIGWDKRYAFGKTAPHAVALAAMLAVGGGDAR